MGLNPMTRLWATSWLRFRLKYYRSAEKTVQARNATDAELLMIRAHIYKIEARLAGLTRLPRPAPLPDCRGISADPARRE